MKTLFLFLLGLTSQLVHAQSIGSDSLTRLLKSHLPNDTAYVRAMDPVIIDLIYKKADYIQADSISQRMIELATRLGDCTGVVRAYRAINQPQKAIPHYQQALILAQQLKFELLQFDIYDGLAQAMKLMNQPAKGIRYANLALQIAEKQQNKLAVCTVYGTLASLQQIQKHYSSAEAYLTKALSLAEANEYKDNRKKLLQQLANLYGQSQNYKLAYSFQLQKNRQIDSAITVRTNAELQRLVAHYETRQKEDRIRLLQQQQTVLVKEKQLDQEEARQARWQRNTGLTGGLLVLLLGGAVSAWLLNRSKLQRLEESQRLRQQLAHDLHDEVGSTLSSISLSVILQSNYIEIKSTLRRHPPPLFNTNFSPNNTF